jgi:TatD DNase family protein
MIDAHCHVDTKDFDSDRGEVIARAKASGIRAIVNAGNNHPDNERVLALSQKYGPDYFKAVVCLSPHHAVEQTEEELEAELRFITSNKSKLVGIGETGLDRHHYSKEEDWAKQERFYRSFLQLGESLDLPVVVHSRNAEERCIKVAQEYRCRVMLHCFVNAHAADLAVESGFMVSIPTLKSKGIDKIIKKTPLERISCETDAPWLWQGGRNEPANVRAAYERVAKIKSLGLEKVIDVVDETVASFFKFKLSSVL